MLLWRPFLYGMSSFTRIWFCRCSSASRNPSPHWKTPLPAITGFPVGANRCGGRRTGCRRPVSDRHRRTSPASVETARRHGKSAGRRAVSRTCFDHRRHGRAVRFSYRGGRGRRHGRQYRPRSRAPHLLAQFEQYAKLNKKIPAEIIGSINGIAENSFY